MNSKTRFSFFAVVTIFMLIFSLANTVVALADDETPLPTPTEEPTQPPIQDITDGTAPLQDDATVAEALDQLPDNTDLVVINNEGEILPLASEEAAEIIVDGDPIWCPSTQLIPTPGANGCTGSFTKFNGVSGLLAYLQANPATYSGAGIIYVESTYTAGGEGVSIVIDSSDGYGMTDLTIDGGWNFGTGSKVGTSAFNRNLTISNWSYNVTLNDLIFRNISGNDGLTISTDYVTDVDIELNNIIARNNDANGVNITNNSDKGTVSINTGTFNANGAEGLFISSYGDILLDNITANNNTADGAFLENCSCIEDVGITLTGTNIFNNNGGFGLYALSDGNISLSNITANRNGYSGAYLDNTSGNGDITLTNITANFNKDGNGVFAYASRDVTIDGGYFIGNDRRGVYAQSDYGNIGVSLSEFINNGMSGLRAEAYNTDGIHGNITLDGISSEKNGIHGANLGAAGNITITGNSEFNNNEESGVHIMGLLGNLFVSDSLFSGNDKHGLDAEFVFGNVTIDNGIFTWNKRNGLNLPDVSGSIDIVASDFLNNKHNGAYLYNCGCTISDITIDSSTFSDNGWSGLEAYSYGLINLNEVTAEGNDDTGAYLDNANGMANVDVENSEFNKNGNQGLYISSAGDIFIDPTGFNINGGYGLELHTSGNINLLDVTANGNGYDGVYLDVTGNATICDSNFTSNNGYGIDASNVAGTLTLGSIFFGPTNNISGDFVYGGSNLATDCTPSSNGGSGRNPSVVIPVTGGEQITCDGTATSTTVKLPNGDEVTLPCPINDFAVVTPIVESELPNPLGDGNRFLSALTANVIRGNQPVQNLEDPMTVSFVIPEGLKSDALAILFWAGTQWVELDGQLSEDGLHFEVLTELTGTFVLVGK